MRKYPPALFISGFFSLGLAYVVSAAVLDYFLQPVVLRIWILAVFSLFFFFILDVIIGRGQNFGNQADKKRVRIVLAAACLMGLASLLVVPVPLPKLPQAAFLSDSAGGSLPARLSGAGFVSLLNSVSAGFRVRLVVYLAGLWMSRSVLILAACLGFQTFKKRRPHPRLLISAGLCALLASSVIWIAGNVTVYPVIEQNNSFKIARLPSNSMMDLDTASGDSFTNLPLYISFFHFYDGSTLVVPPGLLARLDLSARRLISWSRFSALRETAYNETLPAEALDRLKTQKSSFIRAGGSLNLNVLLVAPEPSEKFVCLAENGNETFFIPAQQPEECGSWK